MPERSGATGAPGGWSRSMAALFVVAAVGVAKQAVSPRTELEEPARRPSIASLKAAGPRPRPPGFARSRPTARWRSMPRSRSPISPIRRRGRSCSAGPATPTALRSLDCLTAAIYYEAAREPTEGQRAVAQVVLNRVRHPAYPEHRLRRRLRRRPALSPAANSPSPATVRCAARRWRPIGSGRRRVARTRSTATSMRRSAGRPIITPIMSCLTGPRAWSSRRLSAATFSIAGAAAGAGLRPSPAAMRGSSRRSPGGAASASRSAPSCSWRRARATPRRPRPPPRRAPLGSVDSFQRAVLRRYEPLQRENANAMITERTRADRTLTNSQRWALTGSDTGAAAQAPLGRRPKAPSSRASCRACAIVGIRRRTPAAGR